MRVGSHVLYSKQSGLFHGTFCCCGEVKAIIRVEVVPGVEQERYVVVGSGGEHILARLDELTARKERKHAGRNTLSNGKEKLGVLSPVSA